MNRLLSLLVSTVAAFGAAEAIAQQPAANVTPVPFTSVQIDDVFWAPRIEVNRTVTVPYDFEKCQETGRIDNFAKAGGLMPGTFVGTPFDDSDVYKVIEGAAYSLQLHPDPKLDKYLDDLIAKIAAAQEPDGYIYTARRLLPPEKMPGMSGPKRWEHLSSSHELYNVGHMYEAAVAHFQATGKRTLLDVAIKNANLLVNTFGPGKRGEVPGHEEIEIGLVKLYRATGNEAYLKLAKFYIDERGNAKGHKLYGEYSQDHKPIVEQTEAVGHSVRAGYLYAGVADVAALTGNNDYLKALDKIWEDVVYRKLYLTGGIGAAGGHEGFGAPYDLPNPTAYNETCAAIANALWNHRMFLAHADSKYMDVLERVVYNGLISGVSLSGDRFFYPNPLESRTGYVRSAWFGCSCCPVNVVRFIPSIGGMAYGQRGREIYVNLFIGGAANLKIGDAAVKLAQQTRYPWDGAVKLTVAENAAGPFDLMVRIPGWAANRPVPGELYSYFDKPAGAVSLKVNGQAVEPKTEAGYVRLSREWKSGDTVELSLPMDVRRVQANEKVKVDAGLVALERGPILFCLEGADNAFTLRDAAIPDDAKIDVEHKADLLGGVTVLKGQAQLKQRKGDTEVAVVPQPFVAIPYYSWANRGPNPMRVWMARNPATLPDPLRATVASTAKLSASARADDINACSDQIEPKNSADSDVPRFTWWPRQGSKEWVQYEFPKPTKVSSVSVYWFDDTGRGQCRVPQSWQLLYKDGKDWKPVKTAATPGVAKDQYNKLTFDAVTTSALRIEAQLTPNASGGILEWTVSE